MYNAELYEILLAKKHHAYRKPFDKANESSFTDPAIPAEKRMAIRLAQLFAQETPVFLPGQKIAFLRTVTGLPGIYTDAEWAEITAKHFIHELGYLSNMCADYATTIATGLDARLEGAKARLEIAKAENDMEGVSFLESAICSISTVLTLADRYLAAAEEAGLTDIAATLRVVPHKGATTFRECLQFFRILHYTLWAEGEYHNTIGRFDQFAYPYLKADLDAGRITKAEAEELLEDFFLSFNWDSDQYIGVQLGDNGQSMMLGGVNEDGEDSYNLLSEMCLQTCYELKLIDPKINLRVSSKSPFSQYLEATHLTKAGLGFPQYSNDDVVIPGLMRLGYSEKDARNYTVAACWEFIIPGVAADIPNIGALSYPKVFQKAAYEHLMGSTTFEDFLEKLRLTLFAETKAIRDSVHDLYIVPAPFYSVLMDGCIARARDIGKGSRYNNFGVHGTGLATAADSLEVLRRYVFGDGSVSKEEILNAMKNDFAGQDALLHKCRFETPKMGDHDEHVDDLAAMLMNWFADSLEGEKNERGGVWRAGTGSAMFYLRHAEELDASPDGRRKGEAFGTNYSPSLYAKSKGPFSVIQSFTHGPVNRVINGGPLTMEFHSTVFRTDEGIEQVAKLVKLFIDKGGHQLQLNSVNRERLLNAQEHPENYRNLIVRIWGWSAYFVELDKAYQDHLIARQEFEQ